jgi:hypothetical protein
MGVNPSKSAHFIDFPLPSYPIFAALKVVDKTGFSPQSSKTMKTSHINLSYVIEMAKPSKKNPD